MNVIKLLMLSVLIFLGACGDEDELNLTRTHTTTPIKEVIKIDRSYSRKGNILRDVGYMENKYITMWDSYFGAKQSVYRLQPGEKVIVYGKNGEYVFLAPQRDTNLTGYVLAGWIEFDDVSKSNNVKQVAAIPEYNPGMAVDRGSSLGKLSNKQYPAKTFAPNLSRLYNKYEKKLKVEPLVYDEKHVLQDELELPKRPDTTFNLKDKDE